MDVRLPIDPVLADVATILRCLACGRSAFTATASALTCGGCGAQVAVHDGIPYVRAADEDPAITRERAAMDGMEAVRRPTDSHWSPCLPIAGRCETPSWRLPYGDGSAFYQENEYFRNVARFGDVFDYILAQLGPATGGRLLDIGADMTWSTARLAAAGWRAVGIDINDHLRASRLWRSRAPAYAVINMDMHLPGFAGETFDVVTGFNAFHHTHRLEALVATVAATLRPGGRLGVVEPYWFHEAVRAAFGAEQIGAGINENVYRLEEWHRTFVQAGLELVTHTIGQAFNAIYRKRTDGARRTISLAEAEAEIFAGFYRGSVTGPPALPGLVAPGATVEVPVRVVNDSPLRVEQRRAAARSRRPSPPCPHRRAT